MVLSPLALSLPQDTSCSPIMVQKLDVAPQAACISESNSCHSLQSLEVQRCNTAPQRLSLCLQYQTSQVPTKPMCGLASRRGDVARYVARTVRQVVMRSRHCIVLLPCSRLFALMS